MIKIEHLEEAANQVTLEEQATGQPFYKATTTKPLYIRLEQAAEEEDVPVVNMDDAKLEWMDKETPVIPREINVKVFTRRRKEKVAE